jgi:hypothetical protein
MGGEERTRFDKKTGEVIYGDPEDKPDNDFFEAMDAGAGEQFMAVRPYVGAIKEPDNHPEANADAPDENWNLEYVYGYRCEDSRQNLYLNNANQCVYMTAALGVILDEDSNTQKFFGGGQADHASKHTSSTADCHNNDITALGISPNRDFCATGQVGKAPVGFTWSSDSGEKKARYQLDRGGRGISAIAVSQCGNFVALVDRSNDNNVYCFDANSGSQVSKAKGDTNKIFDIAFTQQEG